MKFARYEAFDMAGKIVDKEIESFKRLMEAGRMIDIDKIERLLQAGVSHSDDIAALIAEVRALREDKARLDFYEANLESDRSREGIYSVWLEHGWGQEFTANSFREAIDHARGAK